MEKILTKDTLIHQIKQETGIKGNDLNIVFDLFIDVLFESLKEGNSISFGEEYPLLKTKTKISKINSSSPRTLKDDYVLASIKIPLYTKGGKVVK